MNPCYKNLRFILYPLTVLLWVLGCALLGGGIAFDVATKNTFPGISPGYLLLTPAVLAILAGCVTMVVGFFGCLGAMSNNQCMTITFCVLGGCLSILELCGGAVTLGVQGELKQWISSELLITIKEKYPSPTDHTGSVTETMWNTIQAKLGCCGVHNYTDWYKSHGWPEFNLVPQSCCRLESRVCSESQDPAMIYTMPCSKPIDILVSRYILIASTISFVIAGIGIVAVVTAISMMCLQRRSQHTKNHFNF